MLAKAVFLNILIDLSHWNANVDFKLAKSDGIVGVIHKATEGTNWSDPKYEERRLLAVKEGLLWGAYHFGTKVDGKAQAEYFLKVVKSTYYRLIALDIEDNGSKTMTPQQADDFVKTVIQYTGKCPVIYGSPYFLSNYATPTLTKCPLWVARYGAEAMLPKGWNSWKIWQYTDGKLGPLPRSVKGIGVCDRDKFNGTVDELKYFWMNSK